MMSFLRQRWSMLLAFGLVAWVAWDAPLFFVSVLASAIALVGLLWLYAAVSVKRDNERTAAENRRRVDSIRSRYSVRIDDGIVTSIDSHGAEQTFQWAELEEVVSGSRVIEGERLSGWLLRGAGHECFVPDFASGEKAFRQLIHSLPEYYVQRPVTISSSGERPRAASMWRKADPYPKLEHSDDDGYW